MDANMTQSPNNKTLCAVELRECPFCGGEAKQFAAYITCRGCMAEVQTAYAIDTPAKWNTRHESAKQSSMGCPLDGRSETAESAQVGQRSDVSTGNTCSPASPLQAIRDALEEIGKGEYAMTKAILIRDRVLTLLDQLQGEREEKPHIKDTLHDVAQQLASELVESGENHFEDAFPVIQYALDRLDESGFLRRATAKPTPPKLSEAEAVGESGDEGTVDIEDIVSFKSAPNNICITKREAEVLADYHSNQETMADGIGDYPECVKYHEGRRKLYRGIIDALNQPKPQDTI